MPPLCRPGTSGSCSGSAVALLAKTVSNPCRPPARRQRRSWQPHVLPLLCKPVHACPCSAATAMTLLAEVANKYCQGRLPLGSRQAAPMVHKLCRTFSAATAVVPLAEAASNPCQPLAKHQRGGWQPLILRPLCRPVPSCFCGVATAVALLTMVASNPCRPLARCQRRGWQPLMLHLRCKPVPAGSCGVVPPWRCWLRLPATFVTHWQTSAKTLATAHVASVVQARDLRFLCGSAVALPAKTASNPCQLLARRRREAGNHTGCICCASLCTHVPAVLQLH